MHDRGSIKWTSMMMPEHVNMLKGLFEEKERKQKPVLDEQELLEINNKLQLAIHNDLTIEIKHYKNCEYHTVSGKLQKIDAYEKYLQLEDLTNIKLENIIDVQID